MKLSSLSVAVSVLVGALLLATHARADPTPPQTHDGVQFRGAIGPAYLSDSESADDGSFSGTLSGVALTVDLYLGGTPTPGLRIGGFISGTTVFSPSVSVGGQSTTSGTSVTLTQVGPYVDWYPSSTNGFHALVGVGFAYLTSNNGQTDANGNPASTNNGIGFGLDLGAGYDWWVSDKVNVGVLARFTYARTSFSQSSTDADGNPTNVVTSDSMITPAILFSVAYR
jgi:hypothetical protein